MKILGIDTSTKSFSTCICEEARILYEITGDRIFSSDIKSGNFFLVVHDLINGVEKIDAIALTIGPGMFTSLRVGLALAKGLFLSRRIPICAVNTLEVIAYTVAFSNFIDSNYLIAPVMEAFQKEIFVALFKSHRRISKDLVFKPEDFLKFAWEKYKEEKIIIAGPGVQLLKDFAQGKDKNRIIISESPLFCPSASKVVLTALRRIKMGIFDDPELLEPHYIKKTSAEAKLKE
ncbi:MAG: tRNA (adenosine(37)-N6)-threonylcarbamoyltransferase complex dimerization subunit type 1 TsaB [candidate division WOR-3 bacterium]